MTLWTSDLTKYGNAIRQWWDLAKSFVNGRGAATLPVGESHVHVAVESISQPEADGDSVSFEMRVRVVVIDETMAKLIQCEPVNIGKWAALKFPEFRWPDLSVRGGSVVIQWPEDCQPRVNVPGPDPRIASVTISDDGTGLIELTGGPDGRIKY